MSQNARLALTMALTIYGVICLKHPEHYKFLDSVDLAFHEAGHVLFSPLGEFVGFLGGTMMQLLVPVACAVYFLRRGDRHAVSVVLWWVAQNLWNVSVYVRDARSRTLTLVGSGEHDWAYILGHLDILEFDQVLGRAVHTAGVMIFIGSVIWGFYLTAWPRGTATDR